MRPIETTTNFDNAVILPRPVLRISYDRDVDFLWGLVPGEVIDGHLDDETDGLAATVDEETDELEECLWLYTRGPQGPLIGFGVAGAFDWDVAEEGEEAPIWDAPRFDVPTLGLREASVGEILLAAQRMLGGSTPDVVEFDLAVAAGALGARDAAEASWRACLACGEMKAHYGLGYTLVELGRPREAFGHLAMHTEICPRNAWAWCWRGRAAEDMGERAEARRCYERALDCEELGSYETEAAERLMALDGRE